MPEPVSGRAELDRHECIPGRPVVEAVAALEHIVNHLLPGDLGQVLIDQQPLVMPQRHLPREQERHVITRPVLAVSPSGRELTEVML